MSSFSVLKVPDCRLRMVSLPVKSITTELCHVMDNMIEIMYMENGIGIASNQIGILERVAVVDPQRENKPLKLVNPEIVERNKELEAMVEGCLSLPGQWAKVMRPTRVLVRYLTDCGKMMELEAEGILARCLQHEIDHLNGILFIDYLPFPRRRIMLRRVKKLASSLK